MTTATATPQAAQTLTIPLKQIRPSGFNPRRHFDQGKLKELADSVRQDGVLEPILVRPVAPDKAGARYEIVAGERRWRAAGQAQLDAVPAIVRQLTDAKALELAVVENVQRQDLHPLDEAEGLQRLVRDHKYTVEDLAARLGKSKSFVWQRLKLAGLPEVAKRALLNDEISASVAVLIARLPNAALQEEATREILTGGRGGPDPTPMTFREAARFVHDTYMLSLAGAPFDTRDAALVPTAGACAACPKRAGNNPDLFGDVARGDTCTDPACFAAKKEAAWKKTQLAAQAAGDTVLPEKDAKHLFLHDGRLAWGSPYVDLAARCEEDPKGRHWQRLLGKHAPHVVLARDDQGKVHRLVRRAEASRALPRAGHKFRVDAEPRGSRPDPAAQAAEAKRRRLLEVARRTALAATAALVEKVEGQAEASLAWWRLVVSAFADGSWHDAIASIVRRRAWSGKANRPEASLLDQVERLDARQLRGLLTELVVTRNAYSTYSATLGKQLVRACELYKIDLRRLQDRQRDRAASKASARAAKKPAQAAGKMARKKG